MVERYKRLYALEENLYKKGSPILIQAGALLLDNQNGKVLAQLKLKNLYHSKLIACKVCICAFNPSGTEVEGAYYSYLDLAIFRGGNFGAQTPVYLPDSTARKISVDVTEAVYEDGNIWRQAGGKWVPVPPQETLADRFVDVELQKQYSIEVGGNCNFVPTEVGDLFLCTCGEINQRAYKECSKCRRDTANLVSVLNAETLGYRKNERLKEEEALRIEKEQKAAEEKREKENKRRKKKKLATIGIVCCLAIVFAITAIKSQQEKAAAQQKVEQICENLVGKSLSFSFSGIENGNKISEEWKCTFTSSALCQLKGVRIVNYVWGSLGVSGTGKRGINASCAYEVLTEDDQLLVKIVYESKDGIYTYYCEVYVDEENNPIKLEYKNHYFTKN